jgi:hypothetical protein
MSHPEFKNQSCLNFLKIVGVSNEFILFEMSL